MVAMRLVLFVLLCGFSFQMVVLVGFGCLV